MKLAAMFVFSLTPFVLSSQTPAPNQAGPVQNSSFHVAPWSHIGGCPVSLRAGQVPSATMMQVQKSPPQNMGQRLHLTLTNPESKQIIAATVKVRGFTFTPGMMNTLTLSKPGESRSSYATRTISVTFLPHKGAAATADIQVPGITAAQTIDLVSLTYADGSDWKLAEGQFCRIAPDPLMLISAQRSD